MMNYYEILTDGQKKQTVSYLPTLLKLQKITIHQILCKIFVKVQKNGIEPTKQLLQDQLKQHKNEPGTKKVCSKHLFEILF